MTKRKYTIKKRVQDIKVGDVIVETYDRFNAKYRVLEPVFAIRTEDYFTMQKVIISCLTKSGIIEEREFLTGTVINNYLRVWVGDSNLDDTGK